MEENRYMAKMRVHELAKELNIKSQEVIDTLNGTQFACLLYTSPSPRDS